MVTLISIEVASMVRRAAMTEKAIREAVAGSDPEINPLTGELVKPEEKPKTIRLSGELRAKYFSDTDPREVEGIVDKALAAWFKQRR